MIEYSFTFLGNAATPEMHLHNKYHETALRLGNIISPINFSLVTRQSNMSVILLARITAKQPN